MTESLHRLYYYFIVNCILGNSVEYNGKSGTNGTSKYIQDYVKPKSPSKSSTGILSHDNIPLCPNGKPSSPRIVSTSVGYLHSSPTNSSSNGSAKNANGVKANRNISWNRDIPPDKLSFTMRREFDKAKEESELICQLRSVSTSLFLLLYYIFKYCEM